MSINLSEFESICRICIGTHETLPINSHRAVAGDITTALLLEYVLQLDYRSDDKLPQHMCRQCMGTLLHLYQFVRMARDSEQQLRKALETSTPDMPLTNKTNTINTFDLPAPKLSTLDMSPSVMNGTADIPASVASCEMNTETILIDTTTLGPPRLPIEDCRDYENHFEDAHEQLGSPPASESDYVLEDVFSSDAVSQNDHDSSTLPECEPPAFIEHELPLPSIQSGALKIEHSNTNNFQHGFDNVNDNTAIRLVPTVTNGSTTTVRSRKVATTTIQTAKHICPYCPKRCRQRNQLISHIRTHTGEKPYSCTHCGRAFSHSNNRNVHMRIHTGERPYRCTVCDRAFTGHGAYKSHYRTHTGEKPYHCTQCDCMFSTKTGLSHHTKRRHAQPPFHPVFETALCL